MGTNVMKEVCATDQEKKKGSTPISKAADGSGERKGETAGEGEGEEEEEEADVEELLGGRNEL
jgi:hypothetical protein